MDMPADPFDPPIGTAEDLAPGIRRIVAPNPSPMTFRGTNTYLVGHRDLAVIDPGPAMTDHLDALLAALGPGQRISHIIVTHTHLDHSPLAAPLAHRTGARIHAFGDAAAGRSAVMRDLAAGGLAGGGEGLDRDFRPDVTVGDGTVIDGDGWALEVLHTPGHLGNHIVLALDDWCFTADHVMGWASSLVSPPDGDLTDFMASCHKLRRRNWHAFLPGHGGIVADPGGRLDWLIDHRLGREAEILARLENGPANAAALARAIYTDTPPALLPAAERNVFAHLIDLWGKKTVTTAEALSISARFTRRA